ncbi:MAG: PolC-type DNA polymerase III [Haliscomenobacter sp.]
MKDWYLRWFGPATPVGEEPFWADYQAKFVNDSKRKEPIQSLRFVVLDTESSGLNPAVDCILSVSAVAVEGARIEVADFFECYVQQPAAQAARQIEIHGILPGSDLLRVSERELAEKMVAFIGSAVLVGHHSDFDRAILQALFRRVGLPALLNTWVDTAQLARRVQGGHEQGWLADLDTLCVEYGIQPTDRHTSSGDAFLTARLFLKLCAQLEKRGIRTLEDLLRRPRIL